MKKIIKTLLVFLFIIGIMLGITVLVKEGYKQLESFYESEVSQEVGSGIAKIEKKENVSTPQVVTETIDDVSETFSAKSINYQSSSSRTNFFYTQLDSYAKTIYDGIAANIDNMKSGNYVVEYGDAFSNILSKENGKDELSNYYQSAIEAFTYDNPEVFFLDSTKMYLNIKTTTKGKNVTYDVFISNADGEKYYAKGFYSEGQINDCLAKIEQTKNEILENLPDETEKKIKQIHDYLVDNLEYDQSLSQPNIYNLYGALVNKECVCEGYAKAFKYLLDEAGVDNVIVIGTATNSVGETENHAWNYVAISGKWYAIDVTWDDPVIQGIGNLLPSSHKYKYYLKGSETMENDHVPSGQFTTNGKIFKYPNINNSDY